MRETGNRKNSRHRAIACSSIKKTLKICGRVLENWRSWQETVIGKGRTPSNSQHKSISKEEKEDSIQSPVKCIIFYQVFQLIREGGRYRTRNQIRRSLSFCQSENVIFIFYKNQRRRSLSFIKSEKAYPIVYKIRESGHCRLYHQRKRTLSFIPSTTAMRVGVFQ